MVLVNNESCSKMYTEFFITEADKKNNQIMKNSDFIKKLFQGVFIPSDAASWVTSISDLPHSSCKSWISIHFCANRVIYNRIWFY